MIKRLLPVFAVIAALAVCTPTLMGKNDKAKGKGNPHANQVVNDDLGWERHDGYDYRTSAAADGRPPGWKRGKKTSWRNCGLPPGQAKKYGCRTYVYQGRSHYYYDDDNGRIIIRRPTIEVHGSVDIVR
jgi:hypothetical protein